MACWRNTVRMSSHNNSRKNSTLAFRSIRLLDQMQEQINSLHYSLRTAGGVCVLSKKFIDFHEKKHQRDMRREQEAALSAMA
jgi:hypothetical protein